MHRLYFFSQTIYRKVSQFHDILKQYWGYDDFRPLQLDIIQSIVDGKDTLGLMPTGGGKSITFQVPALAKDGVCLVITPLISLMKDQVENLRARNIGAAAIYSGMKRNQILQTLENCEFGAYKFLYISPERLGTELFKNRLPYLHLSMIAVDEAHCISQWGYDFRPSYLQIAEIRSVVPDVPILALTATATPEVVDDIQDKLHFTEKNVFKKSFERKNLSYVVRSAEDKLPQLLHILQSVPGTSVVYVRSRKRTKEISDFLRQHQITADFYHAGLPDEDKDAKQVAWKNGSCRVMVATNAFGMGIDKPDVRTVVHMDLPDTLEAYFQEAGRAGRDGKKAYAVMLYSKADSAKLKKRIYDNFPDKDFIKKVYQALADFFVVGEGSGLDAVFPFNLQEFCTQFHLPINPTYSALKIIEMSGYIVLTEELDNPSKLMFTCHKDDLYGHHSANSFYNRLIEMLLRSYTGLFTDLTHISENVLAERLQSDRNAVYHSLIELSQLHLVKYVPFKKTPLLVFTAPRIDSNKLAIPKAAYEERKQRYVNRIESVLQYAESQDKCRSHMLLDYFGEKNALPCGICDVCLTKRKSLMLEQQFAEIEKQIISKLQDTPLSITLLTENMKGNQETVLYILRYLIDQGKIVQNDRMQLQLK